MSFRNFSLSPSLWKGAGVLPFSHRFTALVLGPVYKESGLPRLLARVNLASAFKVSSGLQANYIGRVTLSHGSTFTSFTDVFRHT